MRICQIVQRNLSYLGITWHTSTQQYPIDRRNASVLFVFIVTAVMFYIYLFHVASTFQEYADSIYACLIITVATVAYVIMIWQMGMLLDCVNRMEKIINESEYFDD